MFLFRSPNYEMVIIRDFSRDPSLNYDVTGQILCIRQTGFFFFCEVQSAGETNVLVLQFHGIK